MISEKTKEIQILSYNPRHLEKSRTRWWNMKSQKLPLNITSA